MATLPRITQRLAGPHDTAILRERDIQFLQTRAIDPEVARERGYVATGGADLRELGFSKTQAALGPGLLIPVHAVDGGVVYHQLRPDVPRLNDNATPRKYETPHGQRMALDCHPRVRHQLGNPNIPLVITESAPKADALISGGYAAIALSGCWGWRHTTASGGKAALPDFESIAINDRVVIIAFDSDAWTSPNVADATERLGAWLARKASVRVCHIPATADGQKQGVDDFVFNGGDLTALIAEAVPLSQFVHERPRRPEPESEPASDDAAGWRAMYEAERDRRCAAEDRHSSVVQILNSPSFSPAEAVSYIRAQFEYERLASTGQTKGKRATLYLPELAKTVYSDRDTGEVLDDGEVYARRQRKDLDTTATKHQSMAPATISKALKTVAERTGAFLIAELKDTKTGLTRLTMEPIHQTTRETLAAVAGTFVQIDRRRGRHKPRDPRLAMVDPCSECGPGTDVVIKAAAYCGDCGQHLGTLPDERITAPFRFETEDVVPHDDPSPRAPQVLKTSKTKRCDVGTGFWTARERHFAELEPEDPPFQTKTDPTGDVQRLCDLCRRPLRNPAERAAGHHTYDCMEPVATSGPAPAGALFHLRGRPPND